MKKLFTFPLPVWSVILITLGMASGMLAVFSLARPVILNYSLLLPSTEKNTTPSFSYGEKASLSNPDFFNKIKSSMIEQKTSFVEANLSLMKIFVYKDGISVVEFPILTKGKEGSWWETPAGIYKIASKEENHFSTFGHVYQPWSMAFQGNFFIHGWPYYSDGTPVASTYSGGCIRLADESAKAVYDLASVGMPVLVYKEEFASDNFAYQTQIPDLSGKSYLIADINNNFVFLEKDSSDKIPFSFFSSVLGSLVATDYINIEKNITLTNDILDGISSSRFSRGEKITPFDLLHLSLRQSDSSALRIFANYLTEKRFVSLMNDKANALGMKNTVFSFFDEKSQTTPEDLFYLSKYIYHNRKFVFDISAGRRTNSAYSKSQFGDIANENLFVDNANFVGGKAILNEDNSTSFFGVFEIQVRSEKRRIFVFLANSKNPVEEVPKILGYIKNLYK
jgi:hypothetical protein